ncbi:MAG: carboxylate-amine ligase [Acidiferrobacterales bacterium]|nr:carboxylate-amine ligase [Acidiferrobacterales bacterium]
MSVAKEKFTIGIEEEYLLVDQETLDLAVAPEDLMAECVQELDTRVSPEFLRCQIEVGTGICQTIGQAREELTQLRSCIKRIANNHGLTPIAASCHPFADWKNQVFTDKERYRNLEQELGGVARRMLICGQHVHVGLSDDDLRIDLMNQFAYFLPHLLALSTSSPFWQGQDTGLNSYRLTVFDNLPRTGLPPHFKSFNEYKRSVEVIVNSGLIEDSSKIWWDLRPSARYPTLESRICDVSPRLSDTLALAALTQCLMRMLCRLRVSNQRWRVYDNFLVSENRWRAQRYGIAEGLIDFGLGEVAPMENLLEEIIELVEEDAQELQCLEEVYSTRKIVKEGTSADRQRDIYNESMAEGIDSHTALCDVVRSLVEEFSTDL